MKLARSKSISIIARYSWLRTIANAVGVFILTGGLCYAVYNRYVAVGGDVASLFSSGDLVDRLLPIGAVAGIFLSYRIFLTLYALIFGNAIAISADGEMLYSKGGNRFNIRLSDIEKVEALGAGRFRFPPGWGRRVVIYSRGSTRQVWVTILDKSEDAVVAAIRAIL